MLNMKAMPAAGGAGLAWYLWKEAAEPVPWVAKTDLDYLASQVAQGWVEFEDVVDLEYTKRLARVQEAGVWDIYHDLLWGKASDDVVAAIQRYDAEVGKITGVEYRADTAPELAALLKIDLASSPRLQDLKHLLSGLAADGQQPEGKRRYRSTGERKTMGYLELVFSADKSVSVYAQGDNRAPIVDAQRKAVDAAMQQIAGTLGFLRVRRDGLDHRDPADLTWIQWQHRFSRHGQSQIHTHVSIPNVVLSRTEPGKVGTLDTFALHGLYPTVRETYHRALAGELHKLGLPVVFDPKVPAAVLTNISYEEQRQASSRTVIAEKAAAEYVGAKLAVHFSALTPKQRSAWIGRAASHTRPRTKTPPPQTDQSRLQERNAIRPRLDSRYNRGGGRYDDDTQNRGLRV